MKKWFLLVLLASCNATGSTYTSISINTFPVTSGTRMTSAVGGETTRELIISKEGTLLIRIEDHGVMLNLADFPGPTITTYFDSLDHMPLRMGLPDGTRFAFHGESFEVAGELYELPEGGGVVRYVHPGQVLSP